MQKEVREIDSQGDGEGGPGAPACCPAEKHRTTAEARKVPEVGASMGREGQRGLNKQTNKQKVNYLKSLKE